MCCSTIYYKGRVAVSFVDPQPFRTSYIFKKQLPEPLCSFLVPPNFTHLCFLCVVLYIVYFIIIRYLSLLFCVDPFPYFNELDEDILFMDDGARTPRYTPFFVNSGAVNFMYCDDISYWVFNGCFMSTLLGCWTLVVCSKNYNIH